MPSASPQLTIRFKRHLDDSANITCTRRDGSQTWQRQRGQLGYVFPPHDLTHYAVETTLGFRRGFYGLLAEGWEIGDFATPWPRGPIPPDALEVELIVGFFDAERRNCAQWTSAEFQDHAEKLVAASNLKKPGKATTPRVLTAVELEEIRVVRDGLLRQWAGVGAGEELVLQF